MKRFGSAGTALSCLWVLWVLCVPLSLKAQSADVELEQNWDDQEKMTFWFMPQGSRILPYKWFVHLEQVHSNTLFLEPDHMERFRYISVGESKPNLPIGFAKTRKKSDGQYWLGLTCAACHTAKIEFEGKSMIIEGGPTMADFPGFFASLLEAMRSTLADDDKFTRFAGAVLGSGYSPGKERDLRKKFRNLKDDLVGRQRVNRPPQEYGYGRLDAFGNIFNQVSVFALNLPENGQPPNAPVSYPFIWDTPQHDRVQWNGSASNSPSGVGPLLRNTGEVVGVFGHVEIRRKWWWPWGRSYSGSVDIKNLGKLEKQLASLWSPLWPEEVLGDIDEEKAAKGKKVYNDTTGAQCVLCHLPIARTSKDRRIEAKMVTVRALGTDSTMAYNFISRRARTGLLKGKKEGVISGPRFDEETLTINLVVNAVVGTLLSHPLQDLNAIFRERLKVPGAKSSFNPYSYKARPLNGIWATAPYLHNGSVSSLWELLQPAGKRASSFFVGSRQFDAKNVGFESGPSDGAFEFDTSLPGNRNTGHEYGTENLSDEQKWALIEYLKTL